MYASSQPQPSKDLNLPYPPPPAQFSGHRKEDQEVDVFNIRQHQQQQMNSVALLRYRSAPSSLLGEVCEDFFPVRPTSPETTESVFSRFLSPDVEKSPVVGGAQRSSQFSQGVASEHANYNHGEGMSGFASASQVVYQSVGSIGVELGDVKNNGYSSSAALIRQRSSPAGLFGQLNAENGFGLMRGMGGFRNGTSPSVDSTNRLKGQLSFSSRQNSVMSQISEIGSEGMDGSSPEEGGSAGRSLITGFPIGSWDESSLLSESFSGLKRGRGGEVKILSGLNSLEPQNGDVKNHVPALTHQFSLPKTSSEIAAIEKFLQLQDAVPCKIRAKRGCATHPRSIAERVRRTRISERMRKLQELVPNMDKQTNTADMLDLAVDYIKDLQKQVKVLSETRSICTCSASKQKSFPNPAV